MVLKVKRKRRYRRGYPVAVLVGFEENHAVLWRIFSRVAKHSVRLELNGKRTDDKALYNFYESVLDALKPVLKEGVRTIAVTAPARTTYTQEFLDHVKKHHKYLIQSKRPNRANFAELVGSADDHTKVTELTKTKEFTDLIAETASEEADQIVDSLEKHLYGANDNSVVFYSLKEIENVVYNLEKGRESKTEHLLLTDKYLSECKQKNRINRLLQIAKNKEVKTRVVNAETAAGNRISQFGGIVFFSVSTQ
jgi:stalled ribosome rescue protein Dom34